MRVERSRIRGCAVAGAAGRVARRVRVAREAARPPACRSPHRPRARAPTAPACNKHTHKLHTKLKENRIKVE